jgi:hypothetical protein
MAVSDILDGAFKLYKANARAIVTIVAVLVVPFQVVGAIVQRNLYGGRSITTAFNDPSSAATSRGTGGGLRVQALTLVVALINLVLLPFVAGAIAKVVAASYVGEDLGAAEALRATRRRWWALLSAWFLHVLCCWLPFLACLVAAAVLAVAVTPYTLFIGVPLCLLGALVALPISALFVMTAPAIVTEGLGPIQGLRRAWRLARPRLWAVLGITLLAGFMASILGNIVGGVPDVIALFIGLRWGWILLAVGSSMTALLVTPLVAIVSTLQYFDARIRTEGYDLQVIAAGLAAGAG